MNHGETCARCTASASANIEGEDLCASCATALVRTVPGDPRGTFEFGGQL